jgi:lipoate-protein ligase A
MASEWRVVPHRVQGAYTNMAIDEAIAEAVAAGDAPPTIRLYGWEPAAVSIGYFQALHDEVDLTACRNDDVDVVRRRTGGGAVYHDREVTYSIVGPEALFPGDIATAYETICADVIDRLGRLDIDASFAPINDIVVDGKKISGNAQTRRDGVVLQHGTILQAVDAEEMFTYLRPDIQKVADKHVQSVRSRVTAVEAAGGPDDVLETCAAIRAGLTADRDTSEGSLTVGERDRAATLTERYASEDWTTQR